MQNFHMVNLEIFVRVLFSRNFAYYANFRENKTLAKSLLSFTDAGKSCPSGKFLIWQIFKLANMSFNAIHENKILTKIYSI